MKLRHFPYIIWWAIAVHIVWGIALVLDRELQPAAILVGIHWLVAFGVSQPALGLMLAAAAILAAVSLVLGHKLNARTSLLLLLPQQALLVAALIADAISTISGRVNDNPVDQILLFTVLWPIMVAAILHTMVIIDRHLTWTNS